MKKAAFEINGNPSKSAYLIRVIDGQEQFQGS